MKHDSKVSQDDLDALLAEIEGMSVGAHHNKMHFTPAQDACLLALREKGFSWFYIADWWESKGWKGCRQVLANRYKDLVDNQPG